MQRTFFFLVCWREEGVLGVRPPGGYVRAEKNHAETDDRYQKTPIVFARQEEMLNVFFFFSVERCRRWNAVSAVKYEYTFGVLHSLFGGVQQWVDICLGR